MLQRTLLPKEVILARSNQVQFGPFIFPSMKAAYAVICAILRKYDFLQRVSDPNDEALLLEVVETHPQAKEKTKGLAVTKFEVHPYVGGERTFYFYLSDGSRDNFSIKKCIRNATRK